MPTKTEKWLRYHKLMRMILQLKCLPQKQPPLAIQIAEHDFRKPIYINLTVKKVYYRKVTVKKVY